MNKCIFDEPWIGNCNTPVEEGEFCTEHLQEKCWCGNQATTKCDVSMGVMCGMPVCSQHGVCEYHYKMR